MRQPEGHVPFHRGDVLRGGRRGEPLVLALTAPLALAPQHFHPLLILAALALVAPVLTRGLRAVAAARPLFYWVAVALPLSAWASPLLGEVSWPHLARLLWSLALALAVARRRGGCRTDGLRLGAYLACGAGAALFHAGFRPNELAGVMVLFLPLTVAMALSPALDARRGGRRAWRLELVLLSLLFALVLARTGSRGGLLAAGLAVAAVLAASGPRGRWLLAASAVAALAAIGVFGADRWIELLIFSGAARGLSAAVLLTGRLAIWHRAAHAMADFPFTGLGAGTFGAAVDALYPSSDPLQVEDAHNLYLQTALDLGIPGLAAFLVFVGILVRRLVTALGRAAGGRAAGGRADEHSLRRAQLLGLLGALAAHLLYSLTDAVALGSLGGVAWWFLCGLILALTRDPRSAPHQAGATGGLPASVSLPGHRAFRVKARALAALIALALLAAAAPRLVALGRHNRAAVAASRVLAGGAGSRASAAQQLTSASAGLCRAYWLLGLLAPPDSAKRKVAWSALVECSPAFFELLQVAAGHDRRLAEKAVAAWEHHAEAHFWLARTLARGGSAADHAAAVAHYRRGLAVRPASARAWLELGDLVAADQPEAALEAYAEACRRGDPGANACVRAGATAERLGDVEAAIGWYRTSRWGVSRKRAEELERHHPAADP